MAMTLEKRSRGEQILRHLCCGCTIDSIHSSMPLMLLLAPSAAVSPQPVVEDSTYLTIEGSWRLYPNRPDRWPESEAELPDQPIEEIERVIASVRGQAIVDVGLGEQSPHLIIAFEGGAYLFVNGDDDRYESWNLSGGSSMVMALPEGGIAYWTPQSRS